MMKITPIALACLLAASIAAPAFAQGDAPGGAAPGGGATGSRTREPLNGEVLFHDTCAACHMHDAKGATGAATIPALASNPRLGAAAYPIHTVLVGKGVMPGFQDMLSNAQIAAVITYARTHFGNNYPAPVTEADVAKAAAGKPHR